MLLYRNLFFDKKGQGIVEYAILLAFVVALAAFLFTNGGLKNEVTAEMVSFHQEEIITSLVCDLKTS